MQSRYEKSLSVCLVSVQVLCLGYETFSIKHYEYVSIEVIYSACKFKLANVATSCNSKAPSGDVACGERDVCDGASRQGQGLSLAE